jgi:hypothetical protein
MTEVDVRPGKKRADVARTAAEWCMAMDVRSACNGPIGVLLMCNKVLSMMGG